MADPINPAATQHLPFFITAPGSTDVLSVFTGVALVAAVFGFGILFLRLHTLPERVAHKGQKIQFEIVAILGLLALFTHIHIFWVAALLLAFIDIPDFATFLGRIAGSVEKMAGLKRGTGADDVPEPSVVTPSPVAKKSLDADVASEPATTISIRPVAGHKERDHA